MEKLKEILDLTEELTGWLHGIIIDDYASDKLKRQAKERLNELTKDGKR